MADIFISYSGEDKTQVRAIAELLQQQGWSVWWDREIPIGRTFDSVIEEELEKASCVIVVWTRRSVESEWVKNEANEASRLGKLVPVLLEDVAIPLAYKRTETAMLKDWQGEQDHPEIVLLLNAVSQTISQQKKKTTATTGIPTKENQQDKPREWKLHSETAATRKGYVFVAIIGLLVSLFAVFYYLKYIQGSVSREADQRIFYLILILFGIAASAVVFGIMNSYATLKGATLDKKFNLAGPVVGVVLTVVGGFYLPHAEPIERTITIRVFDRNKNPVTQGDVKIYLQEYIRSASIDKMGQALFTGIPLKDPRSPVKIEISSPGYATRHVDTLLNETGTLEIMLPLSPVVVISGQVKRANETPISDVEINVDGTRYVAYSISNGTYTLRVEEYTLGDEITITTSHKGYEDKTRSIKINAPEIKDVDFVLQPTGNQ